MIGSNIIITLGAPYGVGYEIFLNSLKQIYDINGLVFAVGSGRVLELYREITGNKDAFIRITTADINNLENKLNSNKPVYVLIDIDNDDTKVIKSINDISEEVDGYISYLSIKIAAELTAMGMFSGVCTLPVSKKNINIFNKTFTGHTEFFQFYWRQKEVYMTFVSDSLTIMLLTTHIPIRLVDPIVNKKLVKNALNSAYDLYQKMGYTKKICFLGLDPHAGEMGIIGKKDLMIKDIIDKSNYREFIDGPLPSDTAFIPKNREKYDMYISCYHDQALIPFKMLAFKDGVNLSWGMKMIRTSVDHGTGCDLIGKNIADITSFINAYKTAVRLSS